MASATLVDQTSTDRTTTTETTTTEASPPKAAKRNRAVKFAGIGLAVIAAAAGGLYYLKMQGYESTDNAFIEGSVIQVSPRVGGQVVKVYVQDNQHVERGALIAEIDVRDYEARTAEARAHLADISARADGAQPIYCSPPP